MNHSCLFPSNFLFHLIDFVCDTPVDRIINHNQLLPYWTISTYFIVLTGNQSILGDVAGDLVRIPFKIKIASVIFFRFTAIIVLHSSFCDQPKGPRAKRKYRLCMNDGLCANRHRFKNTQEFTQSSAEAKIRTYAA